MCSIKHYSTLQQTNYLAKLKRIQVICSIRENINDRNSNLNTQ